MSKLVSKKIMAIKKCCETFQLPESSEFTQLVVVNGAVHLYYTSEMNENQSYKEVCIILYEVEWYILEDCERLLGIFEYQSKCWFALERIENGVAEISGNNGQNSQL